MTHGRVRGFHAAAHDQVVLRQFDCEVVERSRRSWGQALDHHRLDLAGDVGLTQHGHAVGQGDVHRGRCVDDAGATTHRTRHRQRTGHDLQQLLNGSGRHQGAASSQAPTLDQRHRTGHMRRGHGGAVVVGVRRGAGGGDARVPGRQHADTRRGHVNERAEVGEAGFRAGRIGCAHRDHVGAVGRLVALGGEVVVAGRHHHRGAARHRTVDGRLVGGRAGAGCATERHVDHLGRSSGGQRCHAGHRTTGRPGDGIGDVGHGAATSAQDAHGHDLGAEGGASHAGCVVGHGGHGAGHVGAVPRRGGAIAGVTRVGGVGVAAIGVARTNGVADEVVATHHVGVEVRVGGDAGVQHGHGHTGAIGFVPGGFGTDAGRAITPLLRIQRVVGRQGVLQDEVGLDVLDVGVGSELAHQGQGLGAAQLARCVDQIGTDRELAHMLDREGATGVGLGGDVDGVGAAQLVGQGLHGGIGTRSAGLLGRTRAVLDDEAGVRRIVFDGFLVDDTRGPRRASAQRQGGDHDGRQLD